jgi:hypothetical protein
MKIAFLPIDNRPVCYTLPKLIGQIDSEIEMSLPERCFLGDLTKSANVSELFKWLKNVQNPDAIILSLDTIAYGGLIPSRRSTKTLEEIKQELQKLKQILQEKHCKIYAFSSIMRISNNNVNQEEKEYWNLWGKKIFEYSYNLHKFGMTKTDIPQEILEDYLSTRKRNFEINKIYLEWQKEGLFDTLIFSKDDCAEFGLNVKEAKELEDLGGFTKTGADEIPLSLLSRSILGKIKIYPEFLEPNSKDLISNYEDVSIENSVKGQIELAGCEICEKEDADIILFINNFKKNQGEIVMKIDTEPFNGSFSTPQKPYMIADVRFANGADNNFVKELFKNPIVDEDFFGYSAWNTSANTLGSLICTAKVKFLAKKYNQTEFNKIQITRFLDDWGYQANIRQELTSTNLEVLSLKMESHEKIIKDVLKTEFNVSYKFPWKRLFEVEIEFN